MVPADVALTVEQRILEAAVRLPAGGLVTGWAALRLAGAAWFDGIARDGRTQLPVPLLLPHASRIRGPGVLVERSRRPRRRLDLLRDLAARGTQPAATTYALGRACGECRSPKESEMLQVWEGDLHLPRPLMNREVLDLTGRVIAVVDLLEEESETYGEYNGAAHRDRERQRRDESRADALRGVGLEGFVLVAGDSERVWRERMSSAYARSRRRPPGDRPWRLGAFVPAPPLAGEDEAALDAIMLDHYRSLE